MSVYPRLPPPPSVAQQLAVEIRRVVDDLETQRLFLLEFWTRYRDRTPLLDTLTATWRTRDVRDLLELDDDQITACDAFFREAARYRQYVDTTEDMPLTFTDRYDAATHRLVRLAEEAIPRLGGVPEPAEPPPWRLWPPRGR